MAISEKAVEFLGNSLATGRPVPGQSLTNSPDQKYAWEQPTEFTSVREATLYVFEILTVPDTVSNLLNSVNSGVGVIDLASIVLYSGFLEGKWNPDVMTLLMEPTMFMIMALAEKAEIDYVLDSGDQDLPTEMSPEKQLSSINQGLNEFEKSLKIFRLGQKYVEYYFLISICHQKLLTLKTYFAKLKKTKFIS